MLNNGHALILLLVVQAKQVVETSVDFNGEFIARMIPKLDWRVLKSAAESVSLQNTFFTIAFAQMHVDQV